MPPVTWTQAPLTTIAGDGLAGEPAEQAALQSTARTPTRSGSRRPRTLVAETGRLVTGAQLTMSLTIASTWAFSGTTTSVLTMPNMPLVPSTWGRMWQWKAHTPGVLAVIRTSQRSPGLTPSVSHSNSALPSGWASRAITRMTFPWTCHGCIMIPSFMNRIRTVSPTAARTGTVAGKPWPLIVKPPSESFEIQMYSRSNLIGSTLGSTMNAPSRPRPTWSVALWWEWYISDPASDAVNS